MFRTLVFTDGASKGNPGPGGWGAVILFEEKIVELGGAEKRTTNNRMELMAAIKALEFIETDSNTIPVFVYSDSSYLINGATKWINGWKRGGWITTQKEEVLNRDLWERLDRFISTLSITWERVAGHADTPGNTRADEIASIFGEGKTSELFYGPKEKYLIDLKNIGARSSAERLHASTKSGRAGKAYSYVSLVNGVIETHKTWDECKRRVEGKKARFKKALSPIEEKQIITEFQK